MPSAEMIHRKQVLAFGNADWVYTWDRLRFLGPHLRIALCWLLNMVGLQISIYRRPGEATYGMVRFSLWFGAVCYSWRYPDWRSPTLRTGWKVYWQPTHWNLFHVKPGETFWSKYRDWTVTAGYLEN